MEKIHVYRERRAGDVDPDAMVFVRENISEIGFAKADAAIKGLNAIMEKDETLQEFKGDFCITRIIRRVPVSVTIERVVRVGGHRVANPKPNPKTKRTRKPKTEKPVEPLENKTDEGGE